MDTVRLQWYTFDQNNSGGFMVHDPDRGIGAEVHIQAPDIPSAMYRATEIGLYFHGVTRGRDCSCCGNRWYADWLEGMDSLEGARGYGFGGVPCYAHYYNGDIVDLSQEGIPA